MKKVSVILGTRPEAIKLCPVILALREHPEFCPQVCATAQHRQMLDQVLEVFGVVPEVDLDLMRPDQSLADLTARAITALDQYFHDHQPDLVLVQGDTSSALAASLSAFYHRVKIGHVEAGLRTGNKYSPFPEELNRVLITHLADYHFAPTFEARANLIREGICEERIFVTGNTVIDALLIAREKVRESPPRVPGLPPELMNGGAGSPLVLITGHRRENFGEGLASICRALSALADRFPDAAFVYPVHLNPRVREPVYRLLNGRPNIHLLEPLDYLPFVALMDRACLILTDSGGIQEEAPSLGKPVLVMRETTERPEAVAAGTARLVGTDSRTIIESASALLSSPAAAQAMARQVNPYGDGHSSPRILRALLDN